MRFSLLSWLLIGWSSAFTLVSDAAAQEKMTPFPEHGVEVPTPDGFVPATAWKGLETPEGASVMVNTVPAPLKQLAEGFTAEGLLKGGMTLVERIEGTPGDKDAMAVFVTQTQQGVEFEKWLTLLGDARSTTMVVVTYPRDLSDQFAEQCKMMALNARLLAGGLANRPPEQVDFELAKPKLLKLATVLNQSQIYTADGTMPAKSPSDPLLVAAKSFGRPPVADIADFAELRLKQTAGTEILKTELVQPNTSDPQLQTCEIIATGKDQKSGVPLVIYQKVLAAPECYYLIVGMVGADRRDEMLPEFQRMAAGFRRLKETRPRRDVASRMSPETRQRVEEMRREMEERQALRRGSGRSAEDDERSGPFAVVDIEDDRPEEERDMRRPSWRGREGEADDEASGRSREKPQPARLGRPKKPLPALKYAEADVKTSPMVGGDGEVLFDELAPTGGLLVGAKVAVGDSFGGSVRAVEPIFQVGGKYVLSKMHGEAGEDVELLIAPPGYAVGGVQVGAGLLMDAMRLVYLPIDGSRLDVRDRKYSEWVGGDGGGTSECVSDGSFVVGLGGTYEREEMKSLRLAYVERDDVEVAGAGEEKSSDKSASDATSADGAAAAGEMRRWTSADGKFSVVGRLENFDGKTATIVKGDGKRVKAPAEKLSPKDQGYLEAMGAK